MSETRLYVGSNKEYNEGSLKGGWIELPVEDKKLDSFMRDVVGIGTVDEYGIPNEEPMIQDWESDMPYSIGESSNVYAINDLCKLWEDLSDYTKEAVTLFCDEWGSMSFQEYGTLLMHANEIDYYRFDDDWGNPYEKLGWEVITNLYPEIDNIEIAGMSLSSFIDIEHLGRDYALQCNISIGDYGYIYGQRFEWNLEDYEDIKTAANDVFIGSDDIIYQDEFKWLNDPDNVFRKIKLDEHDGVYNVVLETSIDNGYSYTISKTNSFVDRVLALAYYNDLKDLKPVTLSERLSNAKKDIQEVTRSISGKELGKER